MLQRYSAAFFAATLITIAILLVMTRLISPVGGDPVVRKMLVQLELRRSPPPDIEIDTWVIEAPPKPVIRDTPDLRKLESDRLERRDKAETADAAVEAAPQRIIDWRAQAQAVVQDRGTAKLEGWMESQADKKYVSIMQGPMPTSDSPTTPTALENPREGYRSVNGDLEVPISENCVMQMRPELLGSSGSGRNAPPLIVCKPKPKMDLSGLEEYLER